MGFRPSLPALAVLVACALPHLAAEDSVTLSPTKLSFTYQIGGALPPEQKVQVKRAGTGAVLDYAVTMPAGKPWLIVTPLAGKSGTTISVRVNPTVLDAGPYSALVQVKSPAMASPVLLAVELLVKNPTPSATVSPSALPITFQTDLTAPGPQLLTLSTDGEPISYTAAASGGTWLSVAPASGVAVSGSPAVLAASINVTGLTPNVYAGKIALGFPNATNKTTTVAVTLTVTPGTAVISSIWPTSAPVGSNDVTLTIRGQHLFQSSSVQAGTATIIPVWVSTSILLATVPMAQMANAAALNVTVLNAPRPASGPAVFTVSSGPHIDAVVNSASFYKTDPVTTPDIAPGEIMTLFGSGLGPSAVEPGGPVGGVFTNTLGSPATVVEFELTAGVWTKAPLVFVQANQINVVAPFGLTAAAGQRLRVTYNGSASSSFTFNGAVADPGVFTSDASGQGQAAALNYDPATGVVALNSAASPAIRGKNILLYATGGGAMTPAITPDGLVISPTPPAPVVAAAVSVTIGGDGATVQSAAAALGSLGGLIEINVLVPDTIAPGKNLPVVLLVAGIASPGTATIAVK